MTIVIISLSGRDKKYRQLVRCRCVCGREFVADAWKVRSGHTKSCGCLKPSLIGSSRKKHGQSRPQTTEYRAWSLMKNRCLNPNDRRYSDYGGRGISVCQEWIDSFEAFFSHVGRRPGKGFSIDRINNDGNYEPGNVRWATPKQQRNNQRRCKKVTI